MSSIHIRGKFEKYEIAVKLGFPETTYPWRVHKLTLSLKKLGTS
jgi:hypothetical protein